MNNIHAKLGTYGLIPFIGLALWAGFAEDKAPILFALTAYAALIFSFIGGVYYAANLKDNAKQKTIAWISAGVMIWAWMWLVASQFGITTPFWLMAISYWALPVIEKRYMGDIFTDDFRRMRRDLSVVAGIALISVILFPF